MRAGVQLVPDPSISTVETGTRHRTAERVAKQSGFPVISVSQSMRLIALYVNGVRRVIEDSAAILSRANQALATLERYKLRLDEVAGTLSALEIEDLVTVRDFAQVAQRLEMVRRIADEISGYVVELGTDGRLLVAPAGRAEVAGRRRRPRADRPRLPARARRAQARPHRAGDVLADLDALTRERSARPRSTVAKALGFRSGSAGGAGRRRPSPRGYRRAGQGAAAARHRDRAGWSSTSASLQKLLAARSTTCRRWRASATRGRGWSAKDCPGWPSPRSWSATSDASAVGG